MDIMALAATLTIDTRDFEKKLDSSEKKMQDFGGEVQETIKESSGKFKEYGEKINSWTIAKGQLIAKYAEKAISSVYKITKDLLSKTTEAYSTFEQLEGGTRLLYGDAYDSVMDRASQAYKKVQMSQNDYLQQANSFATGLKTSLKGDAQAAADLADRIITAQADVVAATGASQESVQSAFAGIMKGNYTMLDNLQLGITPTKQGMQDLINTVNKWNRANGKATKYNMKNLADQQAALVDYIEMQGLAGYAGREAAETIQGTMASTKAAWQDLLVAFGRGQGVKEATKNLAENAKQLLKNMLPVFKSTLKGIGEFVQELIPKIEEGLKNLIKKFKESDSPVLNGIGTALEIINNAINWFIEHQTEAVIAIGAIIGAFSIAKLAAIVSSLNPITLLIADIAGLALLIMQNWEDIERFFTELWDGIKTAITTAWDAVTKWWTGVKEAIAQTWTTIATWFNTTVWQPLTEFFTTAWDTISQLWTDAKALISAAWSMIATWFDETVWQPIVKAVKPVIDTISALWTGVKEAISAAWTTISDWFNTTVWTPIVTLFQPVIDTISGLWTGIKESVSEAWTSVKDTLAPILEPIQKTFEGIVTWVQNAIDKVKEFLGLNDEAGAPKLTEGQRQTNTENLINASLDSGFTKNPDTQQWKSATEKLKQDMESAGFSAEQIETALTKISENADNPTWISTFVSQLTDADAAAEATKTAIEGMDGEHVGVNIDLIVNDPSGALSLLGSDGGPGKGKSLIHKDRRTGKPIGLNKTNAKGLDYVPYDDYVSRLHRGEMVLTASQARRYREGDKGQNMAGISKLIVAAIREGMSDANVNAYVSGQGMTNMVNTMTANRVKARRFMPE